MSIRLSSFSGHWGAVIVGAAFALGVACSAGSGGSASGVSGSGASSSSGATGGTIGVSGNSSSGGTGTARARLGQRPR